MLLLEESLRGLADRGELVPVGQIVEVGSLPVDAVSSAAGRVDIASL